ncbi:DegT/DnrJ/EryC1/StrS family aminotransferase [Flavobacteriaceae bacterium]|nr:DegT/DnrJ/EryC1/StrS family aminotransferase [Flavobacteriaceae bacterium]
MNIPFGRPIIGEEEKKAVDEVLNNPILVHGPKATQFEEGFKEFTNSPYAITVSSCTAGMHLVYFTIGLGPGDEVIVPAQTHIATAHAVELTGAKPVFVDAEIESGNIDISKIESEINKKTKAISVVHYLGVPVDMTAVKKIADKHNLFLLEDCALAPGAFHKNKHVGLHGDVGVFSFYPVKHITTAEGGIIILKNEKLASKLKLKKAFGVDRTHGERKIPGMYDTIDLGFNYRMSEIHAAIGVEQIKKLKSFLAIRRSNFELLSSLINKDKVSILEQPVNEETVSSHYCLSVILEDTIKDKRPQIMDRLKLDGIGTSIYYPQPVPRMKYYRDKYGYDEKKYKNASLISDSSINLPVGPHLDENHMKKIAITFNQITKKLI